jgi:hypothetical protein
MGWDGMRKNSIGHDRSEEMLSDKFTCKMQNKNMIRKYRSNTLCMCVCVCVWVREAKEKKVQESKGGDYRTWVLLVVILLFHIHIFEDILNCTPRSHF